MNEQHLHLCSKCRRVMNCKDACPLAPRDPGEIVRGINALRIGEARLCEACTPSLSGLFAYARALALHVLGRGRR